MFVYMEKYNLKMYINLGYIFGATLLVGRLNKPCQTFSTLACFLKFVTSVVACMLIRTQ